MEVKLKNIIINNSQITGIYGKNNIKKMLETDNYVVKFIENENFFTKKVSDEFYLRKNELKTNDNFIDKIISSLNILNLSKNFLDREINSLSTSEQTMLSIALSLVSNPDILVFDNIFNNLDRNNYLIIKKIIIELKRKYHKLVIIIENDINILYELCSYFIIFKNKNIFINDNKINTFKDLNYLINNDIELPEILRFINKSEEINHKLPHFDDIKDLIKEVYRDITEIKR